MARSIQEKNQACREKLSRHTVKMREFVLDPELIHPSWLLSIRGPVFQGKSDPNWPGSSSLFLSQGLFHQSRVMAEVQISGAQLCVMIE